MKTAMQELIEMMNESVKQYLDNAQQEAIFFAIIEEAKKQLDKEKEQIIDAYDDGKQHEQSGTLEEIFLTGQEYYNTTYK